MEEEPLKGADGAERPVPADGLPGLPPELSTREQELRALVDAGAASPEELRELAAKLKEQRTYEESLWRSEVRPALMQAKKKRFSLFDLRRENPNGESSSLLLGALLAVAVLVLIFIAANTSFLILLVAVLVVLVYAWVQGLQGTDDPAPEPPALEAED